MEFLDKIIFDNTVKAWLIVAAVIAGVLIFKRILSHYLASLIFIFIQRRWKSISRMEFIALTIRPLGTFMVIFVSVFALARLNFPSSWEFSFRGVSSPDVVDKIGDVLILASFFYFVISLIDFIALLLETNANSAKDKSHGQVITFFRDLLKVFVGLIGLLFIIRSAFNQDIGTLLTGLSIVGAALALAAKESIENLIASFIIFFDKPFFTGDTLKVNNVSGTVERIGLRSTRIRTDEKTLVTVPNKQMVDSIVDNLSMRNRRRAQIKLILSEKTPTADIQKFIDAIRVILDSREEEIVKNTVFLTDFSKDGATITIEYFTQAFAKTEFDKVKQKVQFKIMDLMAEMKLEMSSSASNINIINEGDHGAAKPNPIL